jgi:hypothetical protein
VQSLPLGARESAAEEFLARATDFTTGYFRARAFATPFELSEQVKSALSIWTAARIQGARLSQRNVYALPGRTATWQTMGTFYLLIIAFVALLPIASSLGVPRFFVPSYSDMARVWTTDGAQLALSIVASWADAALSCIAGILLGAASAIPVLVGARALLPLLTTAVGFLAVVSLLFGFWVLPLEVASISTTALAVAFGMGLIVKKESERFDGRLGPRDVIVNVLPNVAMSPYLPMLYVLAAVVGSFAGLLGYQRNGVADLFRRANDMGRPSLSLSVVVVFAVATGTTYLLLRMLQGYAAMTLIVWPRLRARGRAT